MGKNVWKISLLLFISAGIMNVDAQSLNIVKDNAEWNVLWYNLSQTPFNRITESIQLEGDSLVEGIHYKKVMRKISSETQHWHGSTEYYELYGLIREEPEGKVFYQPIDQDTVYLLYDFGMNVNDTASMHWCQQPNPANEVIVRIDSINIQHIAGTERRVFYVSSRSNQPYAEWMWLNTWIEGIGATEGLLYSCHCTSCGGITLHELLCYHENDELLFINEDYNSCLVDHHNDFIEENNEPLAYYDGISSILHIKNNDIVIRTITICDIHGRTMHSEQNFSVGALNLTSLPHGIYLVVIEYDKDKVNTLKIIK
jgi:hypothetical protein